VHKESISICVRNSIGKVVIERESVIETKASTILQFTDGLRGDLRSPSKKEPGPLGLHDLLKPRVSANAEKKKTGIKPTGSIFLSTFPLL
jgi:hypothetical protein